MPDEPLIPFAEVPALLGNVGRDGKPVSSESVKRWAREGVRQPDGSRRKLRAVKAGARWATTESWLAEFLTPAESPAVVEVRSPAQRRREVDEAMKKLEALGA